MDKTVSVVVPIYNAERYLETCVRSLTNQTYSQLEILLVDDGSTDGSLELCRQVAAKDSRIRVFHQNNAGPSATRNKGIQNAAGKWLMFADADDWLETMAVERMVSAMEKTNADLVLGGYARFQDGCSQDASVHLVAQEPLMLLNGPEEVAMLFTQARTSLAGVSVWAKLYRTDLIRKHGVIFPENVSYEEDCCFNLQYYRHISKAAVIGHCVYHYRQTPLSLSKTYRPESFGYLLNGYRERRRFFEEIGLEKHLPDLEGILLIVVLSSCQKIALSNLNAAHKRAAYAAIVYETEIQRIIRCAKPPEGKLMAAVIIAAKHKCVTAVMLLMYIWRYKHVIKYSPKEEDKR